MTARFARFRNSFRKMHRTADVSSVLKLFVAIQAFAADAGKTRTRREDGQTMAEYSVVLSVITVAVIAAIALISNSARNAMTSVAGVLPG